MREILFRGKRVDNGQWVEGYYYKANYYYRADDKLCDYIAVPHPDKYNRPNSHFFVDPETIGQYTGKELCGEKLFEGDIVESVEDYDDNFGYPATSHFYSVVVWDEENFCWAFKTDGYIQAFIDWTWDNTMKVGNIHDNPELLKGNKDNG